ncbi:MAG TPA: metalloregulator ArsR/SmtB family transcription factor [Acidimicrobiales bacterium]|nr:metalloregulator ArsR/SmtB family transcription factor [Acidimicrobiales bacterium]
MTDEVDEVDDGLWSAIADPSRRRVIDLLVRGGEATASSLADQVPFTRQAVAKHLGVLEAAGLVTRHREGREVRFRVDPTRLGDASDTLAEVANDWDRRLAAIKRLAEAAHQGARRAGD